MIIGLSILVTAIIAWLLLLVADRQHRERCVGVDIYRYPTALIRALAVLTPLVALMGVCLWQYGSTEPANAASILIVVVFGGGTLAGLATFWYLSSMRIAITDRTLMVRTGVLTRRIDFEDVIDTNLVDGRAGNSGAVQLVVYLKNGRKLRIADTLADFDDLAAKVTSRMAGPPGGEQVSMAKLKDLADRTQNQRSDAWITYVGLGLIALALVVARFV